ncbi:MAG: glutathione synthase [Lysobacteraceae bacterium]
MALDIAVVMDPIASIKPNKDSSLAMLLEAQRRGHRLHYLLPGSLALEDSRPVALSADVEVFDDAQRWFRLGATAKKALDELDVILMRKDPPVDSAFLYDTLILEQAEQAGVLVVNRAAGLRDLNEKLAALRFPQCCPPTRVSRRMTDLADFVAEHQDCVIKPLDGMGGRSIFRARAGDDNLKVILETLTDGGQRQAMIQRYIPEITQGDKRILLVDGEPVSHLLARIPQGGDFRGNLAAGGRGEVRELDERDRWIAAEVGPEMRRRGMLFVGLDVIGGYLTEVNVTSPTCIREIDAGANLNVTGLLFDRIEALRG